MLSGDLSEAGDQASYEGLRQALNGWPAPYCLLPGNHDDRAKLLSSFPDLEAPGGFLQSATAYGDLRLILLDTVQPGRQGGAFCDQRAKWLGDQLRASPDRPTLIFMHHPPAALGIDWIDPGPEEVWPKRLMEVLTGHNVVALCAGHAHSGAALNWHGVPLLICPSIASDISLNFAPMNAGSPDDRPLVERSAPGFALHLWREGTLATFFGRCPDETLARWDAASAGLIAEMLGERQH